MHGDNNETEWEDEWQVQTSSDTGALCAVVRWQTDRRELRAEHSSKSVRECDGDNKEYETTNLVRVGLVDIPRNGVEEHQGPIHSRKWNSQEQCCSESHHHFRHCPAHRFLWPQVQISCSKGWI